MVPAIWIASLYSALFPAKAFRHLPRFLRYVQKFKDRGVREAVIVRAQGRGKADAQTPE